MGAGWGHEEEVMMGRAMGGALGRDLGVLTCSANMVKAMRKRTSMKKK